MTLVEKVARALAVSDLGCQPVRWENWEKDARAAISVVIEEAAKVAESTKPFTFKHDVGRRLTAPEIATAIRALAQPQDGEG